MSIEDKTTEYRLSAIDKKLDVFDVKFSALNDKIDDIKSDLISNRCSQPNLCITHQSQLQSMTDVITRINNRMDDHDKEIQEHEKKIQGLLSLKGFAIAILGVIGSMIFLFNEQLSEFLKLIF